MSFIDNLLNRNKSTEELEEDLDKLKIKADIQGTKTELAERKSLERELKHKYGSGWKVLLGLKGVVSVPTLKSALKNEVGSSNNKIRRNGL